MAKVTNALVTYNVGSNREDLANAIYNIDPFDTPFMSAAGRRTVSNRIFDWQTESLPAVNASNADEEGFTLSNAAGTTTSRIGNTTQISHRDATVAGSQEASDPAGKNSEMAHQMALASKALKRDMETILCGIGPRVAGSDGVARKTRQFEHWLTTNVNSGTGYVTAASETAAITDGTIRTFTEAMFNATLETCYGNGAEPTLVIVGPYTKRRISKFTGRTGSEVKIGQTEAVNTVDLYKSDFGNLKIVPSRFSRTRTALLIDPEFVQVAYFRNFTKKDMAVTGDAQTKMIVVEYGLQVGNEKAHGKITEIPGTVGVDPSPIA